MIKEIKIRNFFSFKDETVVQLNLGVNILVGINGSGKTSFINAFRLLYEGVCGNGFETLFQKEWGGYMNVSSAVADNHDKSIELTFVFDYKQLKKLTPKSPFKSDPFYSIVIKPLGDTSYTIEEKLYARNLKDEQKPYVFLDFKNERGTLSVYHSTGIKTERFAGDTSGQELILRQISDPRRYLPSHTIRTAIAQMALYETFDTSSNSVIRQPVNASKEMRLDSNGSNLVNVINNLSISELPSYRDIEGMLRQINPHFEAFDFQMFGAKLYMSLRETNMRRSIGMRFISDGTIRYVIMMCILLNPRSGYLLGIDEPEGRLHPDMIHSIAQMMKAAAHERQLVVATHSPLLLNDFELEDIFVFEKGQENATVVKKYYEEDFPQYEGELLPGQLWLDGEIGGKRW